MPTLVRSVFRQSGSLPTVAMSGPRFVAGGVGLFWLRLLIRLIDQPLPGASLPPPRALPQLHRQARKALQGN